MAQQLQNSFRTETHGNQTVHMRENSDSALEDLFRVVQNPNPHKQSDWTNRNLPRSFFCPPSQNQNHSRNGSQDSTHYQQNLVPIHTRSRSAPVQLATSLSLPQQAPHHAKQQSVDLVEDLQTMQLSQQSWGNNANSHNQATYNFVGPTSQQQSPQQWNQQSPTKSHSNSALNQSPGALSPNHGGLSPAPSLQSVCAPLPPGWEMSVTPDGEIYYINHMDKTTSWFHPHINSKTPQGPTKLSQLHPQQQLHITQHIQQQQAATLAQQTQQQQQLQQQGASPVAANQNSQLGSPNGALIGVRAPSNNAPNEAYIRTELLKLQKQKETLRRQQEEIAKKEHLLTRTFGPNNSTTAPLTSTAGNNSLGIIEENPPNSSQSNSSQESQLAMMKDVSMAGTQSVNPAIQSVSTSGVDPFLGHNITTDSHARQNSADSGLGMGTSYSLPRTPEDFLSNVDEMDSTDGGHKMAKAQGSDFNMNEMEGMGMDVGGMGDAQGAPMDEHDLMPSLQDDLSSELLDGQKIDNLLTWL